MECGSVAGDRERGAREQPHGARVILYDQEGYDARIRGQSDDPNMACQECEVERPVAAGRVHGAWTRDPNRPSLQEYRYRRHPGHYVAVQRHDVLFLLAEVQDRVRRKPSEVPELDAL